MGLVATCSCGQSFEAKLHLAGKTVRCPSCARPLTIPGAASRPAAAQAAPAPAAPAATSFDLAAAPDDFSASAAWTPTAPKKSVAAKPAWGRLLGAGAGGFVAAFLLVLVVGLSWKAMSQPAPAAVNFGEEAPSFAPLMSAGE